MEERLLEAKDIEVGAPLTDAELSEWETRTRQNGEWTSAEVERLIDEVRRLRSRAAAAKAAEALKALAMKGEPRPVERDSWRKTIGMFRDDPEMERILDSGQRIRESEYE
jgi:hypothetical protein